MSHFSNLYDRKYLFRCLLSMALVFGLMKMTGGAGFVVVVPLVYYGLIVRKTEALFFWLVIAICAIIVNPYVVPKGTVFAWTQRILMVTLGFSMTLNVLSHPKHSVMTPYLGIMAYLGVMFFSSLQGWCPKISILKLILFTLIYFAYFGVANLVGVNPQVSSKKIRSVMLSVALLFTVGSIMLLPFPGLSQLKAVDILAHGGSVEALESMQSLFMGMTNHSQCLGPVVSSISVIVFADLLFSIRKWDPIYLLILLSCPYLIYKTSSRTGMGAFLLGMAFVAYLFIMSRGIGTRWRRKALLTIMMSMTGFLCVLVFLPSFREGVKRFALKWHGEGAADLTAEGIVSSRQALMDRAIYNFKQSPLLGNGFQVGENMKGKKVDGLALSAPIEKGVWITAVLEEGGVIGWLLFSGFLLSAIIISIKRRAYTGAACLFVCTLTNLGEFTFFSMSYTGGFTWAMVFVGLALDIRKMKDENAELRRQMMERRQMMGNPLFVR